MSTTTGIVLLSAALATGFASAEKTVLPRAVIEAGLKKAQCTIPAKEAAVIGTERLTRRLELIEVTCWSAAYNAGSILFAVPEHRPQDAQLLAVETWQDGRIRTGYSISSPGFDAASRTLSATHKARGAGDCGTIQEMKWTGWHFRLLNVWSKEACDGEPFEWDSRERWQVFPRHGLEPDRQGALPSRDRAQFSRQ